jgi:hypothetical protein
MRTPYLPVRVLGMTDLIARVVEETHGARAFWISKESRSRVHVSYRNDNVYAPVLATAVFPCYPSATGETRVVLDPMRYISEYASMDAVPLMFAPLLEGNV